MKHNDGMHDVALLTARAVLGGSIAAHGAQKLFGWFGGPGINGASQMMQHLGFTPGDRYARVAALSEIGAGLLIATGTGGPLGPAMLAGVMTVAAASAHVKNGFWNQNQGYELNVMYALSALLLAVEDHGSFSVDAAIGMRRYTRPLYGWIAFAAGIAAAATMVARRTPPPQLNAQGHPGSEKGTIGASNHSRVEQSS